MKKWTDLTINQKISVKQFAMDKHGKRWHSRKPNFCASALNELQLHYILSCYE